MEWFLQNLDIDEKFRTEVDGRVLDAPKNESPFARFCLKSINDDFGTIVDVGCGNGRDSFFFKNQVLIALVLTKANTLFLIIIRNV